MRWWQQVRERRAVIAQARTGNGEHHEAAAGLAAANRRLRETMRASDTTDRLAVQVQRALRVRPGGGHGPARG
jgi:hypothetical protein